MCSITKKSSEFLNRRDAEAQRKFFRNESKVSAIKNLIQKKALRLCGSNHKKEYCSVKTFFNTSHFALGVLGVALAFSACVASAQAPQSSGQFTYSADKVSLRAGKGVRLDGHAVIKAPPQLEVRADAIAFDYKESQITEVRAIGNVNLKVTMTPKGGGKPTRIETTSDSATLVPQTRQLSLTGNVDGFFQPDGQPRTTLAGTKVVMNYVGQEISGDVSGPIRLTIPAETVQGGSTPGAPNTAIGTVTITAREAKIDGKAGVVRFIGDARAISNEGPNKFDVAAPEFVLTRNNDNTIDTLKTAGRTTVKIDLPPEPTKAGGSKSDDKPGVGKPTHVEATADSAVVQRATNTLTFEGNVVGFYQLAPPESEPQKYDFNGDKAVMRYVPDSQATIEMPAGLKADITGTPGKPVEVSTPAFNFNLGN
jgi:lipopolysaccharide export system protein LptA